MQIERHSQMTDMIDDVESFRWRDLGNCRVFGNVAARGMEGIEIFS